ncbi:MAG: TrkH family potassium uptake protein [Clostridia bacterium]|mgnify:CR=1 FL=1|nr:TrkH family potassium uptake protein [Clostridia bacterium]
MRISLDKQKRLTYPQMIALGYFIIIVTGTVLLSLPIANSNNTHPALIDALFTATSATCVTGLVVFDTYTQWSLFGQLVILLLIQVGGLGFMMIVTMFSMLLRRRIGLKERGLLRESVNAIYIGGIVRLTKRILIGTFLFEGIGAILLSMRFIPAMGLAEGIYNGIFHSVSAFCNAGFDLMGKYEKYSSLTTFSGDIVVNLVVLALIIIGGIGFFVWDDIIKNKLHYKRYQLHTKIVLVTTAILVVAGTICFYIFEMHNVLSEIETAKDRILASLFGAVTPRTAGFNTVDVTALTPASKLLTILLMFVGGSPGSTAGGIKTTTLTVIVISLLSSLRNTTSNNIFGRRLEENALKKASAVVAVNMLLILCAALLISVTDNALSLSDVLFEVTSAIGTVGLSTGITGYLNTFARLIIILLMYSGRVGSLSFALLFTENRIPSSVQNPTEKINIG